MRFKYAVTEHGMAGVFTVRMFKSVLSAWAFMLGGWMQGRRMAMRRYR